MTTPPRLAEWLLAAVGASDALLGDLREAATRYGRRWYWHQVCAYVALQVVVGLARHPVRALWWTTATVVVAMASMHTARVGAQPASAVALRAVIRRAPLVVLVALVVPPSCGRGVDTERMTGGGVLT